MGSIGLPELLIVLFVVLLILGPKRLPALGRSVGGGFRELKKSLSKDDDDTDSGLPPADEHESSGLDGEVVRESGR